MEPDDTQLPADLGLAGTLEHSDTSAPRADRDPTLEIPLGDRLHSQRDAADIDVRHRKAMVLASLFDEEPEPVKIGRFTILRKLGEGGMGVVYLVYDTQLDRRLAAKLLRGTPSSESRARFEREAQAMARLSHPNVVTVFEVGDHEGQLFVAMEFVAGQDLRGWMSAERREWRGVVDQFRQAGEGLMAAHGAGIVHRDFKPDNVLVGADGWTRVADFGLAHGLGDLAEAPVPSFEDSQGNQLELQLTQTGAIMGTPAYMAPEQYTGLRSDALGDQFSFCVALWEALYGQRPFSGRNLGELALAVAEGHIDPVSDTRHVPAWIRAVVTRGLARAPSDRWPSMRALLDALADDPQLRRRKLAGRLGVALGALALVGASGLGVRELGHNLRQGYWNELTEELLTVERERGLAQALDDARRAQDATRMGLVRSYKAQTGRVKHEDPTLAAALLREVGAETRASSEWLSTANQILGQPITKRVLSGHRAPIGPLRFSPDGVWLYSGSDDGELRRWRVESGAGELILRHDTLVTDLALSPDGRLLASSSEDGSVRVWSPGEGQARVIVRYKEAATDVDFGPRGEWLASSSKDGSARVDQLETGRVAQLDTGAAPIHAVDFDPSGEWLVTASKDASARLWRLGEPAPRQVLVGHTQPVYFVRALSPTRAITASDDGTARLWELNEGGAPTSTIVARHEQSIAALDVHAERLVTGALDGSMSVTSLAPPYDSHALPAHAGEVWSVEFTPDGESVLSASFDNTARLTRADGRAAPREFRAHRDSLYRATLDPSGRWLATGSYDTDLRLWDLDRPPLETALPGHRDTVFSVESDPSGEWAITASHDGTARVWNMRTGSLRAVLDPHEDPPLDVDDLHHAILSTGATRAAAATSDGVIFTWELSTLERTSLVGHTAAVWRLALSPGGERLASASYDNSARIWRLDTDEPPLVLRGHEDRLLEVAFDHSGARVLTVSWDGALRVWDALEGTPIATSKGHEGKIFCLRASPDGQLWATGSEDTTVRLWPSDLSHGPRVLRGHSRAVWSLVFNHDGSQLASVAGDGQARVWDVASGRALEVFADHPGSVWDAEFIAGDRLMTASTDGAIRVWALGSKLPPLVLPGHLASVQSLALGLDGHRVISASADGTAKLWHIDSLSEGSASLREQLWDATSVCLSPEQRERELGETPEAARHASQACTGRP